MATKEIANCQKIIRFGAFELNARACELRRKGNRIRLQEQPWRILAILLENPGAVVTRDELRERLWPGDVFVDFDHSLNTAIKRLREALGDSCENPIFIETIPRRGYRFIAPVWDSSPPGPQKPAREPSEGSEAASKRQEESSVHQVPSSNAVRAGNAPAKRLGTLRVVGVSGTVGAAAAVIVMIAAMHLFRKPSRISTVPIQIKSLAVLPFENLSGDKKQDYFADGMTDELIASLAKIHALRVISRTSAMEYKGSQKPLSQIARELRVDAVVEGTVLRSGDQVRISVELVQVATDRNLWAETYESQLTDVLNLQSQVARSIVSEIRINLTPEEQQRLATDRPVDSEAYDDYLKGLYQWNNRSKAGLTEAIHYFRRAAAEDPRYARAYAGLADCYGILGSAIVGTVPAREVAPEAKAAALKALQLDNTLPEAQTALATVQFNYDWDWRNAQIGFQRALDLNPRYATAHQRYSLYLMAIGRADESINEINRARDLDPLSPSINFSLGWRLYLARRYDQAIRQLRNTIDMDPAFLLPHRVLGQAYEQKKEFALAIAELQRATSMSHDSPPTLSALARAYAASGKKLEARTLLDELLAQSKRRYVSPFYIAVVYAELGENGPAMNWLEKAYEDRSNSLIFLKVDPELDSLRSDPRFQALLDKLGLPQ